MAITGNVAVPLLGRDSFQEVDITGITQAIGGGIACGRKPTVLFTGNPARSCAAVAELPKGALVEVEVTAVC